MGLEAATWITDLDGTNPPSGDKKSQGDDHLRMIKLVLRACFPTASKAWYNPTAASKTADFNVAATEMNKTFIIDTTAGVVNATLPALAAGDAGWECSFIKSNTGTSAFYILPPSGTIASGEVFGLAKTRRCIPGHRTRVLWTGSGWVAERVVRAPVGSILDCPVAALPVGFEFAMGQTLVTGNYPDYAAVMGSGVVQDRQGRVAAGRTDMDGSDNGLITAALSGVNGTTLGANGGAQVNDLLASDLPNATLAVTIAAGQGLHHHAYIKAGGGSVPINLAAGSGGDPAGTTGDSTLPAMTGVTASMNGGVTQTHVNKLQPTMITNMIVVVE